MIDVKKDLTLDQKPDSPKQKTNNALENALVKFKQRNIHKRVLKITNTLKMIIS